MIGATFELSYYYSSFTYLIFFIFLNMFVTIVFFSNCYFFDFLLFLLAVVFLGKKVLSCIDDIYMIDGLIKF